MKSPTCAKGTICSYTLECSEGRDVKFMGVCLAANEGKEFEPKGTQLLNPTDFELYETEGGNYIGAKVHHKPFSSEKDVTIGVFCLHEGDQEITKFFGYSSQAKDLYKKAGMKHLAVVEIE